MKKSRSILSLVITVLLLALLTYTAAVGFGKKSTGSAKNINLGLDLAGGVSITYQVKDENPSADDMSDTVYKLQKRVENYSTEATVYQEGDDRITIEIPGVTNANDILEELGKPGSLEFQTEDGTVVLSGTDIKTAQAATSQDSMKNKQYVVQLSMTDEGTEKFAEATEANVGNVIYIIYDDEVVSAPTVNTAITGGEAEITGMDSYEDAETLASTIRIGGLNLELEELSSSVVAAQLGTSAISGSLKAAAIGLAVIFIFMCIVYLLPGLASGIALLLYTAIILVALNAFNMTLTLPGIAGIILGIGMAVDANVIIFARVKEELGAGKSVKTALKTGFQKATSAIVDGNVTTLIAALVLGLKGTGSVKGFAQTLALGIIVSMFSALVITRAIIFAFYGLGLKDVKFYGKYKERSTINFVGKRRPFFALSIAVILVGLITMGVYTGTSGDPLNYSLEFKGGTSTTVEFAEDMSMEEIEDQVVPVVKEATGAKDVQCTKTQGTNEVTLKTSTLTLDEREALNQALVDEFGVDESTIQAQNISATVSSEMRADAIIAVVIATICMLLYIWLRFKDIRFAGSAIIALIHDVLVVLAFYALARVSVGNTFIACMLTIVGYSINATIVIFDRIRENLKLQKRKEDLAEVVNKSITQTLTRSIYTSFTTFIMVAILYVFGVSSIREFALPLIVGIVCGAYSSVCITGSLWYVFRTKLGKKK
jgi:SecD/SecF fusion protein